MPIAWYGIGKRVKMNGRKQALDRSLLWERNGLDRVLGCLGEVK